MKWMYSVFVMRLFLAIVVLFPIAVVCNYGQLVHAQEEWEPVSNEDHLIVEKRKLPTDSLIEVRVRGKIDAPLPAIMNVLADQKRYPEWMKNSKEPKLVGSFPGEPSSRIFYNRGTPAWFLQDRDYYLIVRVKCMKLTREAQLQFTTDSNLRYPEVSGVVRLYDLHGHWHFQPSADNKQTYGEYQLYVDAGGALISAIKNYAVKKLAIQSFLNFRSQVYKTNKQTTDELKRDFPQLFPNCIAE